MKKEQYLLMLSVFAMLASNIASFHAGRFGGNDTVFWIFSAFSIIQLICNASIVFISLKHRERAAKIQRSFDDITNRLLKIVS